MTRYATLEGLEDWVGTTEYNKMRSKCGNEDALDLALKGVEIRLQVAIIPNSPKQNQEEFASAVYEQIKHELSDASDQLKTMPSGVKSFSVNGFSATIESSGNVVSGVGFSKTAQAILRNAGLMYRGVEQ